MYFRCTEPLPNSAGKLAPAVDTRGDGGQVVYPGSIHPDTGVPYEWAEGLEPWSVPIAELPDHIFDLLAPAGRPPPDWTPDAIKSLIDRSDAAVERAILAIFRRQTADEQNAENTIHHNRIGFASCHAHLGSYYAKWILGGRHLDGKHLDKARRMVRWYSRQLCQIASSQKTQTQAA